jgi:hypothetical protein
MADVVKAEGLVIAYTFENNVYPLACAKNSSLNISRDFLELAPKTNGLYREFIPARRNFTISGSGLVKMAQAFMQPFEFFEEFFTGSDVKYTAYLDIIDAQNNYRVFEFDCYIQDLTLDSTIGANATYSYNIQGSGNFTELTVVDTYTVTSGTIPARNPATHKLVAVGYGGKWYYNYTVTGSFVITLGSALNGTSVIAAYIAL